MISLRENKTVATKRKSERTFEQTRKYNEYMRKYHARKRQAQGKPYVPRSLDKETEQKVSNEVMEVLKNAVREDRKES